MALHGDKPVKNTGRDWLRMEHEFVTGDETGAEVARRHGVNYDTLKKHMIAGKWSHKRERYRNGELDASSVDVFEDDEMRQEKLANIDKCIVGVLDSLVARYVGD